MIHNDERYTIPTTPNAFDTFQNELVNLLKDDPGGKGIPADVVKNGLDLNAAWIPVHASCAPAAASKANRAAQNALQLEYSTYASIVMHKYVVGNDAIPADQKARLGVHPLTTVRTHVPAPDSRPELHIDNNEFGFHRIDYRPEGSQGRFSKPAGVMFCEIRYQVGGNPPATPEDAPLTMNLSRTGFRLAFTSAQKDLQVYYTGRFVNNKGEVGGWSEIITAIVRL